MTQEREPARPRILVVEDHPGVRKLLQVALEHHGFDVHLVADGAEAVQFYRKHHAEIALVLMDVQMPNLDGPTTFGILQQINPAVRCCFISGHTGRYNEADLLRHGTVYLAKPFTLENLAGTLRELLACSEAPAATSSDHQAKPEG